MYLVSLARFWWLGQHLWRRSQGCPVLDATSPLAMLVMPLGRGIQEWAKSCRCSEDWGKKSVRNNPENTNIREEGEEETLQRRFPCSLLRRPGEQVVPGSLWRRPCQSRYPHCTLWRTPRWNMWVFPEGTTACGEPWLEQGRGVRRREQQSGTDMASPQSPVPHRLCCWWWEKR